MTVRETIPDPNCGAVSVGSEKAGPAPHVRYRRGTVVSVPLANARKAATEKARGTYRKTAAQFEEFARDACRTWSAARENPNP